MVETATYPSQHAGGHSYGQHSDAYGHSMNQHPQYIESNQSYSSAGQSYAPHSATAGGMSHYQQYPSQPPVLQPSPGSYAPSPGSYGQYSYPNGVTSPPVGGQSIPSNMGTQVASAMMPLPAMSTQSPSHQSYIGGPGGVQAYTQAHVDTTGQIAPPGMKPRVTATLWEDEGSMCFQVEAKGVCVARRDDNHMINGTKLLNVAGMTRGRRDGILKSEKQRHVVKIGPMHLKGVWIPFERALDFANKEKITELLYPLFVHNIGALLYHPTNSNRTGAVMQAMDRRNVDMKQHKQGMAAASAPNPASLPQHHSIGTPVTSQVSQSSQSIASHPGAGRPELNRAHTFPTPPTSASSGIGMGSSGSSYDWSNQSMPQSNQGMHMDHHSHTTPASPATTPPGSAVSTMHSYPGQATYDNTRSIYPANSSQQSAYPTQQANSYIKHEMGPPSARAPGTEHLEHKSDLYAHAPDTDQVTHGPEEEADHEHDAEYSTESQNGYASNRSSYNYNANTSMGALHGDQSQISSDIGGSPHQTGSSRGTPRGSGATQAQWHSDYNTPPRSSSFYNVTSDTRSAPTNGTTSGDNYGAAHLPAGYAPTQMNGMSSTKRMREDDDQDARSDGRGEHVDSSKRRKTLDSGISGTTFESDGRPMNRPKGNVAQRVRR